MKRLCKPMVVFFYPPASQVVGVFSGGFERPQGKNKRQVPAYKARCRKVGVMRCLAGGGGRAKKIKKKHMQMLSVQRAVPFRSEATSDMGLLKFPFV